MNTDKYLNDIDLTRFNAFLQGSTTTPTFHYVDNLPPLSELFPDHVYYAILFKKNIGTDIGHWVVLIKWDERTYEYFDCLGTPAPQEVRDILDDFSELTSLPIVLLESGRQLMAKNNFICGKWVIFRLMTIPHSIKAFHNFIDVLTRGKKVRADDIVNFIVNIPFKEI